VEITATGARLSREQAFRSYVEPQIEVLLRVAQTLTGSWADAEDIVQETLIRAWRAADRFDGAHPRAWLLTILRHTHLNSLRRQRPDLVADATSLETQRPAFGVQRLAGPEERQLNRTLDAALERAVAELDERYRTVLLLIDVDQLTYAEVAAVLDVPLGTVMSRLSRARAKVRRRLLTASSCEGTIR
jgi:RNA polymerase sigma-70 factor (ECF subfamily)